MSFGQDLVWSSLLLFAGKAPGPEKVGAIRFGAKEALVLMHHSWILSGVLVHGQPQFQALVPLPWGAADSHQPISGLPPACLAYLALGAVPGHH